MIVVSKGCGKMKKLIVVILTLILLSGCAAPKKYSVTWYDTFDTVVTFSGYAEPRSAFDQASTAVHDELIRLHRIFDKYHPADGVNGVYAANHGETALEPELVELLAFCDALYGQTRRRTDPRMGALLGVWHEYREAGVELPPSERLERAAADRTQLDMGAVAKGYAVERAAQIAQKTMPSFLIDAGGNIRVGSAPEDGRKGWTVGINNPEQDGILAKLLVSDLSVVTSAVDQRYYEVDGQRYHHLIDPDTHRPGGDFLQVTIITGDSGLADYLSTAVCLLPYDEGRELIESMDGVDAIWVKGNGEVLMTDGVSARLVR